jgi:general secretion pathway protein A
MFRNPWGLRESPFRGSLDWRSFFPSPTHEESLARLQFLVEERHRLGLLFGPTGCGKSLVLEVFARQLRRTAAQVANLSLQAIDLREFLWLTAAELGLSPNRRDDVFTLWRGVLDRLAENCYQQFNTVLLLDDADEATNTVLEHVTRLSQFQGTDRGASRLTILLAANSTTAMRLPTRLLEAAELRIDLEPWEPGDTLQYVSEAIARAGAATPIFSTDALYHLHDLCGGIPRRVNQLANLSLLAAAGRKLTEIDTDTVESAYHELAVVEAVA